MLALIAGRGVLPAAVAAAQGSRPLVCVLQGNPPEGLAPDLTFRLEHLGSLIADLQARGVTRVCLCGAVSRPQIDLAQIDAATLPLVPVLQRALAPGDDGALRAVIGAFEAAGLAVIGAHEAAPDLLPPPGTPTRAAPHDRMTTEATRAAQVLADMAASDEGQACVLAGDRVLDREGPDGTDAMLARLAQPAATPGSVADDPFSWAMDTVGDLLGDAADWLSGPEAPRPATRGAGGTLWKGPKPGQDRRADLPTIGPASARAAARAGLCGISVAAGGVIVLDLAATVAECDRAGLFLTIRDIP